MDDKTKKVIEQAKKLGIVNPQALRNLHIKEEFKNLRKDRMKYEDAINILGNKYFLSSTSIEKIILKK